MSAKRRHRPVNQRPAATDSPRQQGSIFIFRRHDHAISLKAPEVFGQCERNARTASREGGICDRILLQLRNIGDARIFDTPDLFGILCGDSPSMLVRDRYAIHRFHSQNAQRKDATDLAGLQRGKAARCLHRRAVSRRR